MIYEIVSAPKSDYATEDVLRAALAEHKAEFAVENITSDDVEWTVRLAADDEDSGKPDFLKKKDEPEDSDADADSDSGDSEDDGGDEDSEDDGGDGADKGKSKGKKNPSAEVKSVIDQLTGLFEDLGGKVDELQAAHDEKAQKLKDINNTVGEDGEDGDGPGGPPGLPGGPEDESKVGPTPGKPAGPPLPGAGFDKRKPGLPGGAPGGGLPTFTNFQVVTHPGVNEKGEKISLTAAATVLENDPDFENYEVVGVTENVDGSFSAKLKLKS